MFNRFYSIRVGFLMVLVCVLFALTSAKANAKLYFDSNGDIYHKKEIYKKRYVNKKRYAKKKVYNKRKRYAKKRIYKSSKSKVIRSGIAKFKGHSMPVSVANKLRNVETKFGKIKILSSCRPGATVRKTGRPSMHRYCRAVDFNPPRGKYMQVARYLKTTWGGGVGTYSGRFNHIHIDDHRGRWHN